MRHGLLTMRSKYMAAYRKARSHFLKEFTKKIRTVVLQKLLLRFVCSEVCLTFDFENYALRIER